MLFTGGHFRTNLGSTPLDKSFCLGQDGKFLSFPHLRLRWIPPSTLTPWGMMGFPVGSLHPFAQKSSFPGGRLFFSLMAKAFSGPFKAYLHGASRLPTTNFPSRFRSPTQFFRAMVLPPPDCSEAASGKFGQHGGPIFFCPLWDHPLPLACFFFDRQACGAFFKR